MLNDPTAELDSCIDIHQRLQSIACLTSWTVGTLWVSYRASKPHRLWNSTSKKILRRPKDLYARCLGTSRSPRIACENSRQPAFTSAFIKIERPVEAMLQYYNTWLGRPGWSLDREVQEEYSYKLSTTKYNAVGVHSTDFTILCSASSHFFLGERNRRGDCEWSMSQERRQIAT